MKSIRSRENKGDYFNLHKFVYFEEKFIIAHSSKKISYDSSSSSNLSNLSKIKFNIFV